MKNRHMYSSKNTDDPTQQAQLDTKQKPTCIIESIQKPLKLK